MKNVTITEAFYIDNVDRGNLFVTMNKVIENYSDNFYQENHVTLNVKDIKYMEPYKDPLSEKYSMEFIVIFEYRVLRLKTTYVFENDMKDSDTVEDQLYRTLQGYINKGLDPELIVCDFKRYYGYSQVLNTEVPETLFAVIEYNAPMK